MTTLPEPYRFSVEQYHLMARMGILTSGDRVELLDGIVVRKMTKHTPHTTALRKLDAALQSRLPAGWLIITQDPITLATSEPEPDLVLVTGQVDDFAHRHPGPSDVVLVVEVAESSLEYDRGDKRRIYAEAGIGTYWIVNLVDRRIEVFSDPQGGDYASHHVAHPGESLTLSLAGQALTPLVVADLLP